MATLGNTPRPGYVYDTETDTWVPIGVGAHTHAYIPNTLVDAKGDIVVASASDTPAILSKGSDGTVLVSDSTTSTGLAWQPYGAQVVAGKNAIINGGMDIWQRGTTFNGISVGAFTADRMYHTWDGTGATRNITRQTFPNGTTLGTSTPQYFLRYNQSVAGSGGSYNVILAQKIEDIYLYAGQTVTFSFWAKASSATTLPTLNYWQYFGSGATGGSIAGGAYNQAYGPSVSVTTSWQRFTWTFTMPSLSGVTFGSGTPYGYIEIYGPLNTAITIDFWGLQLEMGSVATPFSRVGGTLQGELAACQRYYYRVTGGQPYSLLAVGFARSTGGADLLFSTPVTMRTNPSSNEYANLVITSPGQGTFAISSITSGDQTSPQGGGLYIATSGTLTVNRPYFLGSNNNAAGYFALSAEL